MKKKKMKTTTSTHTILLHGYRQKNIWHNITTPSRWTGNQA